MKYPKEKSEWKEHLRQYGDDKFISYCNDSGNIELVVISLLITEMRRMDQANLSAINYYQCEIHRLSGIRNIFGGKILQLSENLIKDAQELLTINDIPIKK